ncbi:gluconokinase [bacterium]|nr:gluconokinase [bacterium]
MKNHTQPIAKPFIVYVTGVSGSGKSTIGKLLSDKLGIPFYDGDELHLKRNIRKMQSGQPLTDEDRHGWLLVIHSLSKQLLKKNGGIIACSALKERYRI